MKATIKNSTITTMTNNTIAAIRLPINVYDRLIKIESTAKVHKCTDDFDICVREKAIYRFKEKEGISKYRGYVNARFVFNCDGLTVTFNTDGMRDATTTLGNHITTMKVSHWKVVQYVKHLKTYVEASA